MGCRHLRPPVLLARLLCACRRHPAGPRFQGAAHGGHILGAVAEARGVPPSALQTSISGEATLASRAASVIRRVLFQQLAALQGLKPES